MNRDEQRLERIRALSCCACGASPRSQAAHSNFGIHGKGKGIKASDEYTIPLCSECHGRLDRYEMGMTRDESIEWFTKKLVFINKVLSDMKDDEDSIF